MEIPFDEKAKLGYVWLIWALTPERCDLIAIATSEEKRAHYVEVGQHNYPKALIQDERAYVDHLYGRGMLTAMNAARGRR